MAHVTQNAQDAQSGLSTRIHALVIDIRARLARRKVFRTTLMELNALSTRELADLGLSRSEIRRIAYQAAYEL